MGAEGALRGAATVGPRDSQDCWGTQAHGTRFPGALRKEPGLPTPRSAGQRLRVGQVLCSHEGLEDTSVPHSQRLGKELEGTQLVWVGGDIRVSCGQGWGGPGFLGWEGSTVVLLQTTPSSPSFQRGTGAPEGEEAFSRCHCSLETTCPFPCLLSLLLSPCPSPPHWFPAAQFLCLAPGHSGLCCVCPQGLGSRADLVQSPAALSQPRHLTGV